MNVADVRREYAREGLRRRDLAADPVEQFLKWLGEARAAYPNDFTSMVLATADRSGRPSARVVLLKACDERGFVFYSNYGSRKGRELEENPRASLVFYWKDFDRQVRVEGPIEKIAREESEAYFRSRPLGARIGAWVSHQSEVIAGREELERAVHEAEERFGESVPCPEDWGGYRVVPDEIEFWQGRENRLHDRFRYRIQDGAWTIDRLSP
ncbi:MAG TPA: pyridoxamine 5'-phosphate oxidase [Thermoanaerobaculia bacterium]|jgi:pyridoxamine 5'-phosphate oxidase|nr:pyridoxamine 5'-phosphate oxidase [Thermoanaerobaculia bacterium]